MSTRDRRDPHPPVLAPGTVFLVFLGLGLTSFGGPVAHLGYFREAFVVRRGWLSERAYADLVALCQALPGPASSQVSMGIGLSVAGLPGLFAAWLGFSLPSAVLLTAVGYGVIADRDLLAPGVLAGLGIGVVAVVAHALWGMARTLTPDAPRLALAALAGLVVLVWPGPWGQVLVLIAGGVMGFLVLCEPTSPPQQAGPALAVPVLSWVPPLALGLFVLLLLGLPLLTVLMPETEALALGDSFYRAGALVFGGGHVVLPLLQAEVVAPGWIAEAEFLAGYGAAQAVPGPVFTVAAYLGAAMEIGPGGVGGAALCVVAIFLPSLLLVTGVLPVWARVSAVPGLRRGLAGVNAAVVGLLWATLITPIGTSAIQAPADAALALVGVALLLTGRVPGWAVVVMTALAGWMIA